MAFIAPVLTELIISR